MGYLFPFYITTDSSQPMNCTCGVWAESGEIAVTDCGEVDPSPALRHLARRSLELPTATPSSRPTNSDRLIYTTEHKRCCHATAVNLSALTLTAGQRLHAQLLQ